MVRIPVICLAMFLSATATAQSDPDRFEITPYGAYSFGGSFYDIETDASVSLVDSASFGLILNFREGANTQWEILYSLQNTDAELTGVATVSEPLDIDVHYTFRRQNRGLPKRHVFLVFDRYRPAGSTQ